MNTSPSGSRSHHKTSTASEKSAAPSATHAGPRPVDPRWAWHYRTLTRLRDHLLQDRAEKLQENATAIEAHSMHLADSGTDEMDHDLMFALLEAEQNSLNEVNDAILRIHAGRYGYCEETGESIPRERLHAVPWTRYAFEVKQAKERHRAGNGARVTPAGSIRGARVELANASELPREENTGDEPSLADVLAQTEVEEIPAPPRTVASLPRLRRRRAASGQRRLRRSSRLTKKR
jgi:RNA polymerase-binding transcription factor DksA